MTTSVQRKLPNCCQLIVSVFVHHQSSIIHHHHHHLLDCLLCFACLLANSKETRLYLHEKKTQSSGRKKEEVLFGCSVCRCLQISPSAKSRPSTHPWTYRLFIPSHTIHPIQPSTHPPIQLYHAHAIPRPYHAHTTRTNKKKKPPHVVVGSNR